MIIPWRLLLTSQAHLIETDITSRAGRLNEGVKHAKFDMVLLHHPRSIVQLDGLRILIQRSAELRWGAFTQQFDSQHPLLTFTSWYSNHIRGDRRGVYYLDHCLFAQKQLLLDVGLLPEIDIFEDTELCLKLRQQAKGERLPYVSQTSAIRFQSHGVYKQAINNQFLKWQYYFKRSDKVMNKSYESALQLNSQYSESVQPSAAIKRK